MTPPNVKPYYEDEYVTLWHGDCREVLPQIDGDVVVTDPPYGVGVDYDGHDDTSEALEALIADVWPLLERFPVAVVTPGVANIHRWPPPRWMLCWMERAGAGSGPWGFTTWQPILAYGKDPYLAAGMGRRPDGFSMNSGAAIRSGGPIDHPCPKPVDVMRWIVQRVTPLGSEVVVDPFAGSGTTLRAAKDLGRRAVGIEKSERYCELIVKRLAQGVLDFGEAS